MAKAKIMMVHRELLSLLGDFTQWYLLSYLINAMRVTEGAYEALTNKNKEKDCKIPRRINALLKEMPITHTTLRRARSRLVEKGYITLGESHSGGRDYVINWSKLIPDLQDNSLTLGSLEVYNWTDKPYTVTWETLTKVYGYRVVEYLYFD